MRAGLSTIQQTLTPEAASVLNHSIAEARRRNHGQTTPLHVAATLLASSSGFLRQACVRSHPNSSHPLQCRALELCFSVALDRIPSAACGGGGGGGCAGDPPISNALMAALKRAQAHQRRGCPEQQQQPLLAVKVELEQLIVSILDDPSVSRVMREASFSSPAVKATIEQMLNSSSPSGVRPSPPPPPRNLYLSPRLQQHQGSGGGNRGEEVKRIVEILMRKKKRNPVLVGDSEPESLAKEVLLRVNKREFAEGELRDVGVVSIERDLLLGSSDRGRIPSKLRELGDLIEARMKSGDGGGGGGVVVDLGDLKWLVEPAGTAGAAMEAGRAAVAEMGKLLARFGQRVWLVGIATCETYLRCQVYHPAMENDWDLQVVPIAARSPAPGLFPSSVESLSPLKGSFPSTTTLVPRRPLSENTNPSHPHRRIAGGKLCPLCTENYEREHAELVAEDFEKSSNEAKQQQHLPQWLQLAKKPSASPQSTEELQKRWKETCLRLHPNFHPLNPNLLQPFQPKLTSAPRSLGPNNNRPASPPGSPVHTELVLGVSDRDKTRQARVKDSIDRPVVDADSFKRLFKGLVEKVPWQAEAASAVATTVMQCKSGQGRRRGDAWLLFIGPDRVGKAKMASALSELVCGCGPVTVRLGPRTGHLDPVEDQRGKTSLDRVAEAVRRNPFSVLVLEDVDRADALFQSGIRRAVEKGRLMDSHGREASLGGVVFVLTTDWTPDDLRSSLDSDARPGSVSEERLASAVQHAWRLKLLVGDRSPKRRPDWRFDDDRRPTKSRKDGTTGPGLALDLNLVAGANEDSSDLTVESGPSVSARGLMECVTDTVVFRPVDFGPIRTKVVEAITGKFGSIVGIGNGRSIEIDEDVVHRIVGGAWFGRAGVFDEWVEKVLVPSLYALKSNLTVEGSTVVRLVACDDDSTVHTRMNGGDFLPKKIFVDVDGN
ncbi:hypothetical protein QJS10_CPB17g00099 [Acorus calamus]|uniref:Clp R domain-containing protein n=1 Tax=Acorus calamus TaxID=4465 RepID=A0AAV9CUP7_ACOCL|nr:hypothetical protein QJS10_CPB17g00099 [Acorus calamus]